MGWGSSVLITPLLIPNEGLVGLRISFFLLMIYTDKLLRAVRTGPE